MAIVGIGISAGKIPDHPPRRLFLEDNDPPEPDTGPLGEKGRGLIARQLHRKIAVSNP